MSSILSEIPDWGGGTGSDAETWLNRGLRWVRHLEFESVEWETLVLQKSPRVPDCSSHLRCYADPVWRRWVLALFFADLASYSVSSDQVEFHRLAYLVASFPQGFTLAWAKIAGEYWPVGYTGWYPMSRTTFETFQNRPESLKTRMVVPVPESQGVHPLVYLFNYSVAPSFKKTPFSKMLMKNYAQELASQDPGGLAAITVSDDGSRIAQRFGLSLVGEFRLGNETERVFLTETCALPTV